MTSGPQYQDQYKQYPEQNCLHYFTDNKNTIDTHYKGRDRARPAANADMWVQLFPEIEKTQLHIHVFWMPSHTDTPELLEPCHVQGNNRADKLADYAASLQTLGRDQTKPILGTLNMQTLTQKHLVAVLKLMPPRHLRAEVAQLPPTISRRTSIRQLISKSSHPASIIKNKAICHQCNQSLPLKAPQVPDFLLTTCSHQTSSGV